MRIVAALAATFLLSAGAVTEAAEMPAELDAALRLPDVLGARLKDPQSAQYFVEDLIERQIGPLRETMACGQVNAKNSYGAYTGYERFFAKQTRIANGPTITELQVADNAAGDGKALSG
jgi:hypothetical protein